MIQLLKWSPSKLLFIWCFNLLLGTWIYCSWIDLLVKFSWNTIVFSLTLFKWNIAVINEAVLFKKSFSWLFFAATYSCLKLQIMTKCPLEGDLVAFMCWNVGHLVPVMCLDHLSWESSVMNVCILISICLLDLCLEIW